MNEYTVPSVSRALKVLRHVADGNSCTNINRTAKELEINRTTLLRLLHTLSDERLIDSSGEAGGYTLGTGLISLAAKALFSRDIVQVAQPVLKKLAAQLGLSAHLGIIEGRDVLYLLRETPNLHLVSNVKVGSHLPAHAASIGRILLAQLPNEEVLSQIAGWHLDPVTDKTRTTPESLIAQLQNDRKVGIAWSVGDYESGIGAAAAAVFESTGTAVGAINVTGPENEFDTKTGRRSEIAAHLIASADLISQQLGYFPKSKQAIPQ